MIPSRHKGNSFLLSFRDIFSFLYVSLVVHYIVVYIGNSSSSFDSTELWLVISRNVTKYCENYIKDGEDLLWSNTVMKVIFIVLFNPQSNSEIDISVDNVLR